MVALKGNSEIGDLINKKIVGPLAKANDLDSMPDFNDADEARRRQGDGRPADQLDRHLPKQGARFQPQPRRRRRHSRRRLRIPDAPLRHRERQEQRAVLHARRSRAASWRRSSASATRERRTTTTVYDPTCGSGSLLLKVGDEASARVTLYGQEKDAATSGLARMNMILHNNPTALIKQGNTLADPKYKDGDALKTFDYVVANPPFSDKRWSTGLDPLDDSYERFKHFGAPPAKQGDYAYLLHIVSSLKSNGKGACILPHGVLFRGNAEADDPPQSRPQGLHQRHHRLARQSLLRNRHPRLHHRHRQGRRPYAPRRFYD
ncbi:MAG: N-6 DNA methylase [Pyrinomonadaceae bacterium]